MLGGSHFHVWEKISICPGENLVFPLPCSITVADVKDGPQLCSPSLVLKGKIRIKFIVSDIFG